MTRTGDKPIIGIVGGIASGKSTVAAEFAKLGCAVVDADRIAHELLDESGVKAKVTACFGASVLGTRGGLDRKKLADIVFADGDNLVKLTEIIHPPVLAEAQRLIEEYNKQPWVQAVVLDMPLLVETGWHKRCDKVVFIDCNRATRGERAKKMGLFDEKQLEVRENFQISLDRKAKLSDNIIDNNSGLSALAKQVVNILTCVSSNR